jgi:hypothetical protein
VPAGASKQGNKPRGRWSRNPRPRLDAPGWVVESVPWKVDVGMSGQRRGHCGAIASVLRLRRG